MQQKETSATVEVPTDPNLVPLGYYMLFAMVDDIPSEAVIVRLGPSSVSIPYPPGTPLLCTGLPVPNPFVELSLLRYELSRGGRVRAAVFDAAGRRVGPPLSEATQAAGTHWLRWDGTGDSGAPLAAGLYFFRIESAGVSRSGRLVMTR